MVALVPRRGPAFRIDRYEYPNQAGALPTTGVPVHEAEAICEAEGKHLCTAYEWFEACSENGRHKFLFPGANEFGDSLNRLIDTCNLERTGLPQKLAPSGSYEGCHGPPELYDMVGNAYEWVVLYPGTELYALSGSYYGYSDAMTTQCGFHTLVHSEQVGLIDLDAVGFRCCQTEETP